MGIVLVLLHCCQIQEGTGQDVAEALHCGSRDGEAFVEVHFVVLFTAIFRLDLCGGRAVKF